MTAATELPDGVWPVMLTPFTTDGAIDDEALDRLIEWYLDAGVDGLFAVSQSSEMYALDAEERLRLAEHVVDRVDGRVPVVATGTFADDLDEQIDFVDRMAQTGVESVVLVASMLCEPDEDDQVWVQRATTIADRTTSPLGVYECPQPYHRLVSADAVATLADTGRFNFFKDTSCASDAIAEKVRVARNTPLTIYNANTPTLTRTLEAGVGGYSGIAANYYPGLLRWLCANHADSPAAELQRFLTTVDHTLHNKYPGLAKLYLRRSGVDMEPTCRVDVPEFEEQDYLVVDALREQVESWRERLDPEPSIPDDRDAQEP